MVHKSIKGHGGKRSGAGAKVGNRNARRGMSLPEWVSLETTDEILKFMKKVLIPAGLSGELGTRQVSALTTACRVLLEYDARLHELEQDVKRLEQAQLGGART